MGDDALYERLHLHGRQTVSRRKLHLCKRRVGHWGANSTDHQAMRRCDFGCFASQRFGNLACDDIVDLANMTDRILSGSCLEAHRPAGRYQAIRSVAPAHLTIIPRLCRSTGNG